MCLRFNVLSIDFVRVTHLILIMIMCENKQTSQVTDEGLLCNFYVVMGNCKISD